MQRLQLSTIPLVLLLVVGACAPQATFFSSAPRRSVDVITKVEMERSGVSDAYEAVVRLRPGWLRAKVRLGRGESRDGIPIVYAQNMRLGAIQELDGLRAEGIQAIHYINPIDATTRWGMGHTSGVIEVIWIHQPQR